MRLQKYLIFEPYVYINSIKDETLLYNTIDGSALVLSKKSRVRSYILKLDQDYINSIIINNDDFLDATFIQELEAIREKFIGDIVESMTRPMLFSVNARKNNIIQNIKTNNELVIKMERKNFIFHIAFFLNSCLNEISPLIYKQYLSSSFYSKNKKHIDIGTIKSLIDEFKAGALKEVSFLGGNIIKYNKKEELLAYLSAQKALKKNWYFKLSDYKNYIEFIKTLIPHPDNYYHIEVLSYNKNAKDNIHSFYNFLETDQVQFEFIFYISTIDEYNEIDFFCRLNNFNRGVYLLTIICR